MPLTPAGNLPKHTNILKGLYGTTPDDARRLIKLLELEEIENENPDIQRAIRVNVEDDIEQFFTKDIVDDWITYYPELNMKDYLTMWIIQTEMDLRRPEDD